MKPLQSVAMGMVVILLVAPAGGFDIFADPIGWVLVLLGLRGLPASIELRGVLLVLGGLALLVSLPLWVPDVVDALDDADESLAWALDLPRFGCFLLLALALLRAAEAAGDRTARTWWGAVVVGLAAVVVLPVLIFGGGLDDLEGLAGVLVALVPVVMVVLLFAHSGRAWAGGDADVVRNGPETHEGRPG